MRIFLISNSRLSPLILFILFIPFQLSNISNKINFLRDNMTLHKPPTPDTPPCQRFPDTLWTLGKYIAKDKLSFENGRGENEYYVFDIWFHCESRALCHNIFWKVCYAAEDTIIPYTLYQMTNPFMFHRKWDCGLFDPGTIFTINSFSFIMLMSIISLTAQAHQSYDRCYYSIGGINR